MHLLAGIWLSSGFFQLNLMASFHICDYGLNKIFAYTVFFNDDVMHIFTSTKILAISNIVLAFVSMYVSLLLNLSLCLDLILVYRYPFSPRGGRQGIMLIVSSLLGIVMALNWL